MGLIARDLCMADPPAACHCGRCVLRSRLTNREVAELEAEVERLSTTTQGAVSALERYGQHHVGCSGAIHRDGKVLGCACGFANALNAIRGGSDA